MNRRQLLKTLMAAPALGMAKAEDKGGLPIPPEKAEQLKNMVSETVNTPFVGYHTTTTGAFTCVSITYTDPALKPDDDF